MYDNIGGKIKGLAKASFIVAAIAEVITGIALMETDEDLIGYGLLVMFVGPIVAWVSSWLLYGFGEIISLLQRNVDKQDKIIDLLEQKTNDSSAPKSVLQDRSFSKTVFTRK